MTTSKALTETEHFALDLASRVGKTAVEAGGAAAAVTFGGSGLDLAQLTNVSADGKVAVSLIVAFIAAFVSAIWNTLGVFWKSADNRAEVAALGKDDLDAIEDIIRRHVPGLSIFGGALSGGGGGGGGTFKAGQGSAGGSQPVTINDGPPAPAEPEPGTVPATNEDGTAAEAATDPEQAPDVLVNPPAEPDPRVTVYDADGNALGLVEPTEIVNGTANES